MQCPGYKSQSGNALFLILIAVVLFAALSYAVMQDERGSGNINSQRDALYAAQITQIGADIRTGVQQMILSGTPATSIVTGTPGTAQFAGNGSLNGKADFCTSGVNCLFAPEGGGVTIPQVPKDAYVPSLATTIWTFTSYFAGTGSYNGISIDGLSPGSGTTSNRAIPGVGTAAADDMAVFAALTKGVCAAINKGLGISGIPLTSTLPAGLEAACMDRNGAGSFEYYQVLVAN